jgi:hypothetical protein
MAAEPRANSEATVRLPKLSAETTVQIAAPKGGVATPPAPPESKLVSTADPSNADRPALSPLEKAQRRLIKNLVIGGFFVVLLVIVFYFLSRS